MAARKTLRQELRREQIVEAAGHVFAEHGIAAATLDQVGERVGLSKASLYYYVASKDDLVASVLASVLADIDRRAADLAGDTADPLELLKTRAQAHVEVAIGSPLGQLIVSSIDAMRDNPTAARLLRDHEEPARQLLQAAQTRGAARDIDIVSATKLLYGALNSIPRWYRPDSGSLSAVLDQTWTIFLHGVASPRGELPDRP
ncbi:TetR/AcrR family transcriptional regulator [Nocardia sp. NPDC049707]|uniref:TetR/AcrR family transcriptional regulator n=1 Tax=Nocardia sp. NPDC049707 TaxID=3154735 RepID=UPI0034162302